MISRPTSVPDMPVSPSPSTRETCTRWLHVVGGWRLQVIEEGGRDGMALEFFPAQVLRYCRRPAPTPWTTPTQERRPLARSRSFPYAALVPCGGRLTAVASAGENPRLKPRDVQVRGIAPGPQAEGGLPQLHLPLPRLVLQPELSDAFPADEDRRLTRDQTRHVDVNGPTGNRETLVLPLPRLILGSNHGHGSGPSPNCSCDQPCGQPSDLTGG